MDMTVWYSIDHEDFPHCKVPLVLVGGLEPLVAEKVVRAFYNELQFLLGDDINARVWAE